MVVMLLLFILITVIEGHKKSKRDDFEPHIKGITKRKGKTKWHGIDVEYHVIDDLWVYEGCMIVGTEANGVDNDGYDGYDGRRRLSPYDSDAWSNGIIPYQFDSSVDHFDQNTWDEAINDFHTKTSLKLVARTNEPDYINIIKGSGCYSYVGHGSGARTLSLGSNCFHVRVIIHELGHAIGLHHTHSRSDRDDYITINTTNIQSGEEDNFDKKETTPICGYYDYTSIMHYSETGFSSNDNPTIEANDPSLQKLLWSHSCKRLTENDMDCINNYIYDVLDDPTKSPTSSDENIAGLSLIHNDNMKNIINTGWTMVNSQNIETQYIASLCPNRFECTSIGEKSLIYKTFSTVGHSNIKLFYDLYIGADSSFEPTDIFYVYYSCSNGILHLLAQYTDRICPQTEIYELPQSCYNTDELTVYFYSDTSSTDEITTLNDFKLYGENNLNYDIAEKQYVIFEDNMNDYTTKWNTISNSVGTASSLDHCGLLQSPPCTEFYDIGGITLKNDISTIGYRNIVLLYDVNVGPDNSLDANRPDTFSVYYSCDGTSPSILLKQYTGSEMLMNETLPLPSSCDNIEHLSISFIIDASNVLEERVYLNNVYVIADSATLLPTKTPTIPTKTPTAVPTGITQTPSKTPTSAPIPTPAPTVSIISDLDGCNSTGWIIMNPNYVNTCYSSTDCLSTSNICTSIKEKSLIYKTFSTEGYSSITLTYDINIGPDNSLDESLGDKIEVCYSCKNHILQIIKTYSGSDEYLNEEFNFPSECDDTDNLILYFKSQTSTSSLNERALISDILLSGYIGSGDTLTSQPVNIYHDDMEEYTNNWIKNGDTISIVSISDTLAFDCIIAPCIDFNINGEITSNDISTIDYQQVTLHYDTNIVPNNWFESGETFSVYYSCDGTAPSNIVKQYDANDDHNYYIDETFNFPSSCDDINNLKLSFKIDGSSSEFVYLRNVNILAIPNNESPTTKAPTSQAPTTKAPTSQAPTTQAPTSQAPTTKAPTTQAPTTQAPTTQAPTTKTPTNATPSPTLDGCDFDIDEYLDKCYCDGTLPQFNFDSAKTNPITPIKPINNNNNDKNIMNELISFKKNFNQFRNEYAANMQHMTMMMNIMMMILFALIVIIICMVVYLYNNNLLKYKRYQKVYNFDTDDIENESERNILKK